MKKTNNAGSRQALIVLLAVVSLGASGSVTEEARRAFLQGVAISKEAKTPEQQKIAVESFERAVRLAPEWTDALYNLAAAQELAGDFAAAQATLGRYIEAGPGEEEVRQAQDKIYALEGKAKLAAAETAAAAEAARTDFSGAWLQVPENSGDPSGWVEASIEIVQDGPGHWRISSFKPNSSLSYPPTEVRFSGRELVFRAGGHAGYFQYRLAISDDGSRLSGTWRYVQYDTTYGLGGWAARGQVPVTFTRS